MMERGDFMGSIMDQERPWEREVLTTEEIEKARAKDRKATDKWLDIMLKNRKPFIVIERKQK